MKHQLTMILLKNFTTAVWLLKSSYVVVVTLLSEGGVVAALDVDDNVLDVSVARPAVLLGDAHAVHAARSEIRSWQLSGGLLRINLENKLFLLKYYFRWQHHLDCVITVDTPQSELLSLTQLLSQMIGSAADKLSQINLHSNNGVIIERQRDKRWSVLQTLNVSPGSVAVSVGCADAGHHGVASHHVILGWHWVTRPYKKC